jgi:3'(2'), 5'-bisphosphate nucleotidase
LLTCSTYFNLAQKELRRPDPAHVNLMVRIEPLARAAGDILLSYYGRDNAIDIKEDGTPATVADRESSIFLVRGLSGLTPAIPVVSEENEVNAAGSYWAVDPLDGTKEFIGKTGGFSIRIALIEDNRVALGMVFCPAQDVLYASVENGPSVRIVSANGPERIRTRPAPGVLTTLFNATHGDFAEYNLQRQGLAARGIVLPAQPATRPGLPRNLQIAAGDADVHLGSGYGSGPQKGSGFVWDLAPDDLILRNAGGGIMHLDGSVLTFDRPRERMAAYIAYGDPAVGQKLKF